MRGKLGYDRRMRYWTGLSTLSVVVVFALAAAAQLTQAPSNGVPPPVTSPGVGGRQFNGAPPSVTSVGFGGRTFNGPPPNVTSVTNGFVPRPGPVGVRPQPAPERHRHHEHQTYYYPYFIPYYPVADPDAYGGPLEGQPSADPEEQDQYQGGPTIFDRRGSGERARNDYADDPPAPMAKHLHHPEARKEAPDPPDDPPPAASAVTVANQPNTILVFRDGHKQEVSNYAIVGANLFDLTPGHRLKIALADLDVAATEKANEDQGIDFTLPAAPGGN